MEGQEDTESRPPTLETQHSMTLPQTTGLSGDHAWDIVTVSPCAPRWPET